MSPAERWLTARSCPERDADDVGHPATPFAEKLTYPSTPSPMGGVLGAKPTPAMVVDVQLLP